MSGCAAGWREAREKSKNSVQLCQASQLDFHARYRYTPHPMKRVLLLTITALAFYTGFHARQLFGAGDSVSHSSSNTTWSVYFSPRGGCTEAVVHELDQAKSTVSVQAYSFTSAPIAKALVEAYRRGVKVEVILDRSQRSETYSSVISYLYRQER